MKITLEQEQVVFKPVTITLETAQEYFSLLAALGITTHRGEVQELGDMGLVVSDGHESPHDNLYALR